LSIGIKSELIFGALEKYVPKTEFSNKTYLEERVKFSEDKLMDEEGKGVMMAWEKPLMEAHAKAVCAGGGGDILNVGFGMGLVDMAIQSYDPVSHTIIEAHPEVYARMLSTGWAEKSNVRILFGRWQDVLPQLGVYDGKCFLH
jgi:protein arginine N-methyltransferase 2